MEMQEDVTRKKKQDPKDVSIPMENFIEQTETSLKLVGRKVICSRREKIKRKKTRSQRPLLLARLQQ